MADFLDLLVQDAQKRIGEGYYEVSNRISASPMSLRKAIYKSKHIPIIAEIKIASPSLGTIRKNSNLERIVEAMKSGGAVGISVLTEPKHFEGSLTFLKTVRKVVNLPILMKDIIINPVQIEAASKTGANAVLLIEGIFERGYCGYNIHDMIAEAHSRNLEVLLENHNEKEFQTAVNSNADLIGINNRDLRTLGVDLETTKRILEKNSSCGKIVVSESGVKNPADIRFLHKYGAKAFLIGSAIMLSKDVEKKVKEFVMAI